MRCPITILQLCAALICTALWLPVHAEDAATPNADVEKLIELLEKGDFDQRKSAAKKLEALGDKARAQLQKALKESDSPEVRDSVEKLLANLQRSRLVIEALDTHGKPVVGAEATLVVTPQNGTQIVAPDEEIKPVQIKTDDKGRYVYDGAGTGSVYVNLQWQHYQQSNFDNIWINMLSLQPGETRLRVILQRGGSVSGKVVSADGDAPLEVNVHLVADSGQDMNAMELDDPDNTAIENANDPLRSVTNMAGEFTIDHVPEGRYIILVRHAEYVTTVGGAVQIEEDKKAAAATIKMNPKSKVHGAMKLKFFNEKGEVLKNTTLRGSVQRVSAGGENNEQRSKLQARLTRIILGMAPQQVQEVTADENGDAEIKDLLPGNYWLLLRQEQSESLHHVPAIKVEAGKTTTLPELKPVKTGGAGGMVLGAAGHEGDVRIVALNWENPYHALMLRSLKQYESWLNAEDEREETLTQTDALGKYELKRLIPGRYSFCFIKNNAIVAVTHGIEVAADKTTAIPDFKLSGAEAGKTVVKGIVLLPDGNPAMNASISVLNNAGSSVGFNAGEDGTFSASDNMTIGAVTNAQVVITYPGYLPHRFSLATPGLDLANLRIVLEKQVFGSVAVQVRDGEGRPLKGAQISLSHGASYPFGVSNPGRTHVTEKNGRALLKGIAVGKHSLQASLDGYYLDKSVAINVKKDTEASVELTMKRGFNVAGKVRVPEGVDPASVLLYMQRVPDTAEILSFGNECWHSAAVDATGRFEFTGVQPGKVRIHGLCPGLLIQHAKGTFDAEITEKPEELSCTMIRAGSAMLDFGEKMRGRMATLIEPGTWKTPGGSSKYAEMYLQRQMSLMNVQANSLGQLNLGPQLPGKYDLMVSPETDDEVEYDGETVAPSEHHAEASIIFPGIEIAPSAPGAATAPVLKFTPPEASASVCGTVRVKVDSPWQSDEIGIGSLALTIIGERALGSVEFSLPETVDVSRAIQTSGTPPPGYHVEAPGEFCIANLPPGNYQVFADFESFEGAGWSWSLKPVTATGERKPIKQFTVAKGEKAQLGELQIELPASVRTHMREQHAKQQAQQAEINYNNANGEDDGANFQP